MYYPWAEESEAQVERSNPAIVSSVQKENGKHAIQWYSRFWQWIENFDSVYELSGEIKFKQHKKIANVLYFIKGFFSIHGEKIP